MSMAEKNTVPGNSELENLVPTIGQIYRMSEGFIRYFNRLGKPSSPFNWDYKRHWLTQVWTLQKLRDEDETLVGGIYYTEGRTLTSPTIFNANIQGAFQVQTKKLADIIAPLRKIEKNCLNTTEAGGCSILREMRRCNATSHVDKIAGLSLLLLSEFPLYPNAKTPEEAWVTSLMPLQYTIELELLYNFPLFAPLPQTSIPDKYRTLGQVPVWNLRHGRQVSNIFLLGQ